MKGVSARTVRKVATSGSSLDYRALAEFRHQLRRFLTFSEEKARGAGIEPQQHQLLLALKGLPESERPTIRVLAARLLLKHHTVVELVDRLADRKLVVRQKSDADGREILVKPTLEGERILRRLAVAHQSELREAGPALVRALEGVVKSSTGRAGARRSR
jgi:DNA-binding MarR family transcriptional regulator